MLRFGVLGPVTVVRGTTTTDLGTPMLRRLVAILLCRPGQPMPMDTLLDAMWEAEPPDTARKTLQVYVHRLRRALGEDERVLRSPAGYSLAVAHGELDATEFCDLVQAAGKAANTDLSQAGELYEKALGLWRGPAFDDALQSSYVAIHARQLEELRLGALEKYAAVELTLGRPERVTSILAKAVAVNPYAETLRGNLMLAYYRCGRQAEALAEYLDIRRTMIEELGLEPGQALRDLHEQVLKNDPGLRATVQNEHSGPAQLPRRIRAFAGRVKELSELDSLSSRADANNSPTIVALTGTAGVGKTTLAVHWAHCVAGRFPAGQLYVNLRGFDATAALAPTDALRGFLSALGVAPERIPPSVDEQTGLYRSRLAKRPMIVVLDNARDADQVRPLLPGVGGHLVIVTSRIQLTGLVATDDAYPLRLDVLTEHDSWRLLSNRLTGERLAADADGANRIITGCARLPLALAVVAARALVRPDMSLTSLAADLEGHHASLDPLAGDDLAANVRAAFSWSYRDLSEVGARLFRLLAIHPGPDVEASAVANLAGITIAEAESALAELVEAQLVSEESPGRYGMHDLLRRYASELVKEIDNDAERDDALTRMLEFYLLTAFDAAMAIHPNRLPIPVSVVPRPVRGPEITSNEAAQQWFSAELPALRQLVELAGRSGMDEYSWKLAWAISDFMVRQSSWSMLEAVQLAASRSARRMADPAGLGYADRFRAIVALFQGRLDDTLRLQNSALRQFKSAGLLAEQSAVYIDMAAATDTDGPSSRTFARQALDLARRSDFLSGQANALNALGMSHITDGHYTTGLPYAEQALQIQLRIADLYGAAATWGTLGLAHHNAGDFERAIACYGECIKLYRHIGRTIYVADYLVLAGDSHQASGHMPQAREAWQEARELYDRLGVVSEDLKEKLAKAASSAG